MLNWWAPSILLTHAKRRRLQNKERKTWLDLHRSTQLIFNTVIMFSAQMKMFGLRRCMKGENVHQICFSRALQFVKYQYQAKTQQYPGFGQFPFHPNGRIEVMITVVKRANITFTRSWKIKARTLCVPLFLQLAVFAYFGVDIEKHLS